MSHLENSEKVHIYTLYGAGFSARSIARQLGRNASTITRFLSAHKKGLLAQRENNPLIAHTIHERIQQYTTILNLLFQKQVGMSHINDYTRLFGSYLQTDVKPDKKYSMLYTMLNYLNIEKDHVIADIGCGTGYFTHAIAKYCEKVVGLDNNPQQIEGAKTIGEHLATTNVEYILSDMREYNYPLRTFDSICAPFIINYSKNIKELELLCKNFFTTLKRGGRLVGLIDNPRDVVHNNKEYGSIKTIPSGHLVDGSLIELQLFNNNHLLCTLYSCYYMQKTIENTLLNIGFSKVEWKKPLIAPEGINQYPSEYWINYVNNCDIAYFVAIK